MRTTEKRTNVTILGNEEIETTSVQHVNYVDFAEKVAEELRNKLTGVEVHVAPIQKNNGIWYHGITVRRANAIIAPTVYIENFIEEIKNGVSVNEIADEICQLTKEEGSTSPIDVDEVTDFNKVKERICFTVINKEKNEALLQDTPYRVVADDLALVYRAIVKIANDGIGSFLIKDSHLKCWNVDENTLYKYAKVNTPHQLPVEQKSLLDFLGLPDLGGPKMEVITNRHKLNGAGVVLYDGVLKKIANECSDDLWVIPSSIHECIIAPEKEIDVKILTGIIQEVNCKEVEDSEILSDHPYKYLREEDKLIAVN